MKLSDYVVKFVASKAEAIFLLSGGGIMHLVDSVGRSKLKAYCCHHEQGAAIAAEGYARIKNNVGVVLVTSGPGGTNAITGAAGAWLDSIPMLVISGQVKTDNIAPRVDGKLAYRQLGFQELNLIDIVKPITKYAVMLEDTRRIRYHLEKAVYLATHGRPGPVWIEIPLDLQASQINTRKLVGYKVPKNGVKKGKIPIKKIAGMLRKARRPLILVGNGVRLSGGVEILWKVIKKLKINVVTAIFTADDVVTGDYDKYLGRQGMPGNEPANYAMDNCDLLLVVGSRLQLTQTSYDYQDFAVEAKKIMVDIDEAELHKKTLDIDVPVWADAKVFLEKLYKEDIRLNEWSVEIKPIDYEQYGKKNYVNVYKFLLALGEKAGDYNVATANGMASVASHQVLKINKGQRFITNAGLGHMGSGLPLAVGACVASGRKPTICMEGDGSIMLNIQELQTIVHHKLPIKIFLFNNGGYFSIRNTHTNYFQKVFAADSKTGVSLPNFEKLTKAWGLKYVRIAGDDEIGKIGRVLDYKGPVVCELMIDPWQKMLPKWMAGRLEDTSLDK